jgi:aminomethyltransferase
MSDLRPTPLHARTAALNTRNTWIERNGFTLARDYGDREGEALAARFSVVVSDISWRWRVTLDGARSAEATARLFTRDASGLAPGTGLKALWLNDAGAVRGAGLVARLGDAQFLLAATAPDPDWILGAASRFEVEAKDATRLAAGIALIGPYAARLLSAAGLDPALEPLAFRTVDWRGLTVTLSRWGEHGGYELWCGSDDATIAWDRLFKAGASFKARVAGAAAMDMLDIERGVARPGRDYRTAVDGLSPEPQAASLGLERLIDETHEFNGRTQWLARRARSGTSLKGLVFDGEIAAPHSPVMRGVMVVGRTFSSVYSPALRRAIALAQLETSGSAQGAQLFVTLPTSADAPAERRANVHIVDLPFLPNPDPIPP